MVAAKLYHSKTKKMAKRNKKKRTTSRRRRVGALAMSANSPLVKFGSIAAGYFLAGKVNDAIDNAVGDKVDGKIVGAAEAGIGLMLLMAKGKKSTAKTAVAGFALGLGANKLLKEFGVINGFENVPVIGGYQNAPVLSGYQVGPGGIGSYLAPRPIPRPISTTVMGGIGGVASNTSTGTGLGYMDSDR